MESWRGPAGDNLSLGHCQQDEAVYDETIDIVIDSHVFTPGPVGGLQDAPGGVLEEACRRHL